MFSNRTNWNLTTNRLSEALAKHRVSRKPLLDLSASNPTECGFTYSRQDVLKAFSHPAALRYVPNPKGIFAARRSIARYHSSFGKKIVPEDIFLTTGTSEAYG